MIQFRVFVGTLEELSGEYNKFLAGLPSGVNVNQSPLTLLADGKWMKEVLYVLPQVPPGRLVPAARIPNGAPN